MPANKTCIPLIDRDLSWLQFNERVLAEAQDVINPLLDRAKFLAITDSNLDEFFMIRFSRMRPREAGLQHIEAFNVRQRETLIQLEQIFKRRGIRWYRSLRGAKPDVLACAETLYRDQILPHLPSAMPFQLGDVNFLENGQSAVIWRAGASHASGANDRLMMLPLGRSLPNVVEDECGGFFAIEAVLQQFLEPQAPKLFLRVTRDSDVEIDLATEDPESIPDVVRRGVRNRDRGRIVRIHYFSTSVTEGILSGSMPGLIQDLQQHAKLSPLQMTRAPGLLSLTGLHRLVKQVKRPELLYPPISARKSLDLSGAHAFERLDQGDVMLHHPYDSFDVFVDWIQAACEDPQVIAIDQTIYRMDTVSPVLEHLKHAARTKRVRVVIEPRARFDELNNLKLAEDLRRAGVEVSYGAGTLKVHAKMTLVTRDTPSGLRRYTHLSTGNYNSSTARQYTDLSILTSDPRIGEDAHRFFEMIWDGRSSTRLDLLVLAPSRLHRKLLSYIRAETVAAKRGHPARIVAKVNALVDPSMIRELYAASQAGVEIDLIVRGACSLVPGIPGVSDRIRVISIVDRFLEHSRIYYFSSIQKIFLSSADWMPRNFFSRLEIAFPVLDPKNFERISKHILPIYLSENVKARALNEEGRWVRLNGTPSLRAQEIFASPPSNVKR